MRSYGQWTFSPFSIAFGDVFICPEQLNRWPCHSLSHWVTNFYFCHTTSNSRDLRPLRHLISVMRRHDLTEKPYQIPKIWIFFGKFSDFWKIFRFLENFQIFGKISDFRKVFRFSKRASLETYGLRLDTWDTDYISDNWEQQY